MPFKLLQTIDQLPAIDAASNTKLQVLFKHSTRCSVSSMAKRMLEHELPELNADQMDVYYLDLLAHRNISNEIATRYGVPHESPQLLFIKNGKCIYHASHDEVSIVDGIASMKV